MMSGMVFYTVMAKSSGRRDETLKRLDMAIRPVVTLKARLGWFEECVRAVEMEIMTKVFSVRTWFGNSTLHKP